MKKAYVTVTTRLIISTPKDQNINEVIENMDYSFASQTKGAEVIESEILDWNTTKEISQ